MKPRNMLLVAACIEKANEAERSALGFNMTSYCSAAGRDDKLGHGCGTTACIAGWTLFAFGWSVKKMQKQVAKYGQHSIKPIAAKVLGLTNKEADQLFIPYFTNRSPQRQPNISAEAAIDTLRVSAVAKKITWVEPLGIDSNYV